MRDVFTFDYLPFLKDLIPLLLEVVEGIGHFVSDEEVAQKHIDLDGLLSGLMWLFMADLLFCCGEKALESFQIFLIDLNIANQVKINIFGVRFATDFHMVLDLRV
jgi:hypothetical protein